MVQGVRARIGAIIAVHLVTEAGTERREKRRYKIEMTHYYLGYVSLALYIASFLCYARFLYVPDLWLGRMATFLLAGGIVMHYFALLERSRWIHTVPYNDLYGSMSLFAWLLGITYLGLELFHRQRSVGAFVTLLLIVWIVLLSVLAPNEAPPPPPARGPLFAFHVTLETWAYAAFALSFVLSLIYLGQDRVLRSRKLATPFWRFPALDVLDRMARSSVYVGLVALITGDDPGIRLGTSAEWRVLVGRPEGGDYACDFGSLCRISQVVEKHGLARRSCGEIVRV